MASAALSMASTLVVLTEDPVNLPLPWLVVVLKQLFPWGLKDIKIKKDKIFVNLLYSPAAKTLKQKFGNLPVRYMRVQIESDEDFKVLESVVRRYRFNLVAEEVPNERGPINKVLPSPYYPAISIESDDDDDDSEEEEEPPTKKRITRSRAASTAATRATVSSLEGVAGPSHWSPPSTLTKPTASSAIKTTTMQQQQQRGVGCVDEELEGQI